MNAFTVTIRPDYLEICEGDHCAAAILDLFDRWSFGKKKRGASTWIYKKRTELCADLLGMFGLSKVASGLIKLREWGYLDWRENPVNRQDKTLQYQFNQAAVNEILLLLGQSSDDQNESSERLNLISEALETRHSLTDSASDSSSSYPAEQTPTPARVEAGGGVQATWQPVSIDSILDHSAIAEAPTVPDEHEPVTGVYSTHIVAGSFPPPPVPRRPLPSDDELTEEETRSSGATPPVDVPQYANIFAITDAEVRGWIDNEPERLSAWCAYAAADDGIKSPGGFVRAAMRTGKLPPKSKSNHQDGQSYITGELAKFILH